MLIGVDPGLGVFAVAVAVALFLVLLERTAPVASDTLLGILSHSTLALGIVILALSGNGHRHDLMSFLFGDVLAVTARELAVIWGGGAVCLALLAKVWRSLVAATLHADLARAEGIPVLRLQILYVVLMAAIVAAGMRVVGSCSSWRSRSFRPPPPRALPYPRADGSARGAAGIGRGSSGSFGSLWLDTPSGPSIVVAAACSPRELRGLASSAPPGSRLPDRRTVARARPQYLANVLLRAQICSR